MHDANRVFVSTTLSRLEALAPLLHNKNVKAAQFVDNFFEKVVVEFCSVEESLVTKAFKLTEDHHIIGLDAMHVAAALECSVDEFVTTEKKTKPMYQIPIVVHLSEV